MYLYLNPSLSYVYLELSFIIAKINDFVFKLTHPPREYPVNEPSTSTTSWQQGFRLLFQKTPMRLIHFGALILNCNIFI